MESLSTNLDLFVVLKGEGTTLDHEVLFKAVVDRLGDRISDEDRVTLKEFCRRFTRAALERWQRSHRHGSTHNSFRAEDDIRVTETTPLVRFPDVQQTSSWRSGTTLAFGLLLTLLLLGSVIGIYLLYLQNQSDNVLPPVDTPLLLVSHEEWCNLPTTCHLELDKVTAQPSKHIVVVQTGTAPCNDTVICSELLKSLQDKNSEPLLYNFLVSSNGVTFEGLGWETQSPMFPSLGAIVVAFIGNFTKEVPTTSQIEEAFTLFDTSNSQGHLTPDFTIVGKVTDPANVPVYLFNSLQNLTQWDHFLSDEYKI